MSPAVTEVHVVDGYRLSVSFEDGKSGILDMSELLNFGVFQRIRDEEHFRSVRVSFDTIEWDGGVDLDPEYVYSHCHF